MKKTLLIGIAMAFSMVSFAQKTEYHFQDTQARLLDVTSNAYVKPLTVELNVLTKEHKTWVFPLTNAEVDAMKGDLVNIRSYAVYAASKQENCDVIVAATFNVKSVKGGFEVTVVGYPANFINWKTATKDDYEWIKMEKVQTTSEKDKIAPVVKKETSR